MSEGVEVNVDNVAVHPSQSSKDDDDSNNLLAANLRSVADFDPGDDTAPVFIDHFSLRVPSSTVKFRGARVHVYESNNEQILLQDSRHDNNNDNHDDDDDDDNNGKNKKPRRRHTITVKRMSYASFGLRLLRLWYALISILIMSYFFVFCFQIILFLFMNLPVESGVSSLQPQERDYGVMIFGTLLSVPVFLYGMSTLMAGTSTFVGDSWSGGTLLKAVFNLETTLTELIYFACFILVPVLTFIVSALAGHENPWEQACFAWVPTITVLFCVFFLAVVWREIDACFTLLRIHYNEEPTNSTGTGTSTTTIWQEMGRLILLSHTHTYSGHVKEQYLVAGDDFTPDGGFTSSPEYEPEWIRKGWYTRLTELSCFQCMYETLDEPKRLYEMDEVRDVMPFVTKHNWSLEGMFCSSASDRKIVSARGPSAVTRRQITSSIVCNIVGTILVFLILIGFIVWIQAGGWLFLLVASLLFVVCCMYPMLRSNRAQFNMYAFINDDTIDHANVTAAKEEQEEKEKEQDEEALAEQEETNNDKGKQDDDNDDELPKKKKSLQPGADVTMFRVWETVRITKPKTWVCVTLVVLEITFFFLWPLITLYVNDNPRVGVIFLIVGFFSFLRRFWNVSTILSELGSMDTIDIETKNKKGKAAAAAAASEEEEEDENNNPMNVVASLHVPKSLHSAYEGADRTLIRKARLADIVGNISNSKSVTRWMWVFGFWIVGVLVLFLGAVGSGDGLGDRPPIVLVDTYYYEGEDSLQYPTCQLTKQFTFDVVVTTAANDTQQQQQQSYDTLLVDYAMMSAFAYETTNVTSYILPRWFGSDDARDEDDLVAQWRIDSDTVSTPTYFKLFTFSPLVPELGIVSIRGSQTLWDWAVNMQLWSSAGLVQAVKWLTPYGWIWTPVLDELVEVVSWIQSSAIGKVSYYQVTTQFVNSILDQDDPYNSTGLKRLFLTGASLGGGLAIITGAQTKAPAVAISGLGAELSRNTFTPAIEKSDIDNYVFNFIPDRDYVARIGGRPRQHQEAQCTASNGNLFGCHSMWRSVCEIAYRCGTGVDGYVHRPIPCRCVYQFDYAPPKPMNDTIQQSFAEACAAEEEAFLKATGSNKNSKFYPYTDNS